MSNFVHLQYCGPFIELDPWPVKVDRPKQKFNYRIHNFFLNFVKISFKKSKHQKHQKHRTRQFSAVLG